MDQFEVKVFDQDSKLQVVFSVGNSHPYKEHPYNVPDSMITRYPALGSFLFSSHEQDGSHDEYKFSGGFVEVRKL